MADHPAWAWWESGPDDTPYSIGIEEETMLLEPASWELAHPEPELIAQIRDELGGRAGTETHDSVFEIATSVRGSVPAAAGEIARMRYAAAGIVADAGLCCAVSGTHPSAVWQEVQISPEDRYRDIHETMRELARREPTLATHLHVGIADPELAIRVLNRMRVHLPLLLALSANSPFCAGRDTALASSRIPLFSAFPRVRVPRRFGGYDDWVAALEPIVRSEAIADPSYLWWDVRLQPRYATVEIRIMDAQSRVEEVEALAALAQCLVRAEAERGLAEERAISAQESIEENRFRAARDGVEATLIDPGSGELRPVHEIVRRAVDACQPDATALGCEEQLAAVEAIVDDPPAARQRREAGDPPDLDRLTEALAGMYRPARA